MDEDFDNAIKLIEKIPPDTKARAMKDFNEAIRLEPTSAAAYYNRGRAELNHDKKIKDFDHAIRLDPHYAFAYCGRGHAWLCKQDYDRAIWDFEEAIPLDPHCSLAYSGRRLAWQDKGQLRR